MAEKLGRTESRSVVDHMLDEAERRGFAFAVAVVDPGGHIISAGRTDGATALNVRMAYNKAYTSIIWQADTRALRERLIEGERKPMAWFGDPLFTPVWGGVLLRASDGTILGAIGESGPPEEVDEELAPHGGKALQVSLAPCREVRIRGSRIVLPAACGTRQQKIQDHRP